MSVVEHPGLWLGLLESIRFSVDKNEDKIVLICYWHHKHNTYDKNIHNILYWLETYSTQICNAMVINNVHFMYVCFISPALMKSHGIRAFKFHDCVLCVQLIVGTWTHENMGNTKTYLWLKNRTCFYVTSLQMRGWNKAKY